jgi:hypothetical protein
MGRSLNWPLINSRSIPSSWGNASSCSVVIKTGAVNVVIITAPRLAQTHCTTAAFERPTNKARRMSITGIPRLSIFRAIAKAVGLRLTLEPV